MLLSVGAITGVLVGQISFTDVAAGVGLTGSGSGTEATSWEDFDCDSDEDLYWGHNSGAVRLYRNTGGMFTDVAAAVGLVLTGGGHPGAAWGDYDGDGDPDIYISSEGAGGERMYRWDGASFTDITAVSGLNSPTATHLPSWLDFDQDGDLDLYIQPPSGAVQLYQNTGGVFSDVAAAVGLTQTVSSGDGGAAWGDYDGDGDLDLLAGSTGATTSLWENLGGTFANVTAAMGLSGAPTLIGAQWFDYDNDGDLDIWYSYWSTSSYLYRNDGATFTDVTVAAGVNLMASVITSVAQDFDNDGDIDVWTDGNGGTAMYRNNGDGTFTDVFATSGLPAVNGGHNGSAADYDRDGDMDFFAADYSGAALHLMRNNTNTALYHWLQLDLVVPGSGNRDAIGALATLYWGGANVLTQDVRGGHMGHGGEQDSKVLHFGLGSATAFDSLVVTWPGGATCVINGAGVSVDTRYTVSPCALSPYDPCQDPVGVAVGEMVQESRASLKPFPGKLTFTIPASERVKLSLYDASGRAVAVLAEGAYEKGTHSVALPSLPSGAYIGLLEMAGERAFATFTTIR